MTSAALVFNKATSMTEPEYSLAPEDSDRSVNSSNKSSSSIIGPAAASELSTRASSNMEGGAAMRVQRSAEKQNDSAV